MAMMGKREPPDWGTEDRRSFDFFDLKGRIEQLMGGLHLGEASFAPATAHAYLHPGHAAEIRVNDEVVGALGELHPLVKERYEFGREPVVVAELDIDLLRTLTVEYRIRAVPDYPPVLEDIAMIVDESVPARRVETLIRQAGGPALVDVRLFDLYRGDQIQATKKSLAYNLTYQAMDHTMTDAEAAAIRNKIVRRLEQELGAVLRA